MTPDGRRRASIRLKRNPACGARSSRPAKRKVAIPENYIQRVIQFARRATADRLPRTYDTDWDSEAYLTVSGQNSNNSVRVTDAFLQAVAEDGDWNLIRRTDGKRRTRP